MPKSKKTKPKGKTVKHPCVFSLRDIARLRGELEGLISIPVTITLDSLGHHNLLIAGISIGHEDLMASAHARLILGSTLRGLIGALAIIENHNAHILEGMNNERSIENQMVTGNNDDAWYKFGDSTNYVKS